MSGTYPIARRLLEARNDARMAGKQATRARIRPADMRELESWMQQQNRTNLNGLPQQNFTKDNIWGMKVVEDPKVRDVLVLEFT